MAQTDYSQQENENLNSDLIMNEYITSSGGVEELLDAIADALIQSPLVNTADVQNNQKFIRDGKLQTGQGDGVLALYQTDVEANVEDNLTNVANMMAGGVFQINVAVGVNDSIAININSSVLEGGTLNITNLVFGNGNPLNVSQFIPIQ